MPDAIGLHAKWVLAREEQGATLMDDAIVVVDGSRIAGVLPAGAEGAPERRIELGAHLLMPGFVNTHTHCVSGPLFRGIMEDREFGGGESLISAVMMPLGEIASEICDEDDIRAIARLGQFEALRSGSTTVVDMPRSGHEGAALAAQDLGIRAYLHPYVMSGPDAAWSLEAEAGEEGALAPFERWHARFDGHADGRIRIGLGPHAPDTCAPALLRQVARARDAYDAPVTVHLAQSAGEIATIAQRLGLSPARYLDAVGLLHPGLIAAHCVHASPEDLDLLAERGVTIAHCPLSFARIAQLASRSRFLRHGVRTTIGSDAHALDILADLRQASINCKYETGEAAAGPAWEMVEAATAQAADAIGRPDLGRIAPGCTADLIAARLDRAHLQPVFDPLKALVWNGSGQDIDFVMVDGEPLLRDGRMHRGLMEQDIAAPASAALGRVWDTARKRGVV